ncbi:MAG TPA: hypothetical protein PLS62_05660 [Desulfobacteraceae bacterium]|nr:hypothetical protein [Desulfobacteraceae bacterium]
MSKIIIGIHGLGNKPPEQMLEKWWKASIMEGLAAIGKTGISFNFKLVYWADYLYKAPLDSGITDKKNPLYLAEPYVPRTEKDKIQKPNNLRRKVLHYLENQMEKILLNDDLTINYSSINDFIIHHFFSDLETYYTSDCTGLKGNNCRARDAICLHLARVLEKYRRKKIMLITHSMGSIIAYDVLTKFAPNVPIDTFVTIGSPLGLPVIKSRIFAEHEKDLHQKIALKTPGNVLSNWYNLSDLKDKIAMDYGLSDDFEENSRHVHVKDKIVTNNYKYMGKRNSHKVYGYLRTPELAEVIEEFLRRKRYAPFIWIRNFVAKFKALALSVQTEI